MPIGVEALLVAVHVSFTLIGVWLQAQDAVLQLILLIANRPFINSESWVPLRFIWIFARFKTRVNSPLPVFFYLRKRIVRIFFNLLLAIIIIILQ